MPFDEGSGDGAMNLYLITQPDENVTYDTYDSAVVAAASEDEARNTHPDGSGATFPPGQYIPRRPWWSLSEWTEPENVSVQLIGTAASGMAAGVLCSSFNAG